MLDLNNGKALLTDNGFFCLINGNLEFAGNSWAKINNGEDVATINGKEIALNNANYQPHLLNDGRVIILYRSDYSGYLYSSIRLRYFNLASNTWSNPYILVENYAGESDMGGLYEPYGVEYSNNQLKVFFSCDAKSSIAHGSIIAHPEILLTGTAKNENWQNTVSFDLNLSNMQPVVSNIHIVPHISGTIDIKRPGMTSVTKLSDGSYAMVMECLRPYESNSSYDYGGFIGISYSRDLINWTDMAPLIYPSKKGLHGGTGPNKYQNGAPYIVSLPNGMIAVSYMTDATLESDYYFTAGAPSGTRTRYRRVEYRVSKTVVSYGDSNIDMTNYEGTRNYAKNEGSRFGGIAFFDNKLIVMSGRYELTGNDSATVNASKYLYMTYHQYLG